jgi:anthranilate phosphoribosyltransferase
MPRDLMTISSDLPDPTLPRLSAFYARVIKRLGRNAREGEHGMLDADDATALWRGLLAVEFSPAQEAALLMGLRVHGESAAMLAAFARVTLDQCRQVQTPAAKAVVVLHCLGTARRQPILAPLLALSLAQRGVPVLMVTHDARRGINTTAVLEALGEPPASTAAQANAALLQRSFAWMPVEHLAPSLARVLERRAELGFRNTAHSLIKLLVPVAGRALVVANYTHAPYRQSFAQAAELMHLSALLVRGTEGDPIAWEADTHPPLAWLGGVPATITPHGAPRARGHADLPEAGDVAATARFCERVLRDEAAPPDAIARQVFCLADLAAREAAAR